MLPYHLLNLISIVSLAGYDAVIGQEEFTKLLKELTVTRRKVFQLFHHPKSNVECVKVGKYCIPSHYIFKWHVNYPDLRSELANMYSQIHYSSKFIFKRFKHLRVVLFPGSCPTLYVWNDDGIVMHFAPMSSYNPHIVNKPGHEYKASLLIRNALCTYYDILSRYVYLPKRVEGFDYTPTEIQWVPSHIFKLDVLDRKHLEVELEHLSGEQEKLKNVQYSSTKATGPLPKRAILAIGDGSNKAVDTR